MNFVNLNVNCIHTLYFLIKLCYIYFISCFLFYYIDHPQCYITSRKVTGFLVLEKKIFKGFLSYIGVAVILVIKPKYFVNILAN